MNYQNATLPNGAVKVGSTDIADNLIPKDQRPGEDFI